MEFILLLSILSFAVALPRKDAAVSRPNCIRMTPEKEQQIDEIVEKLGQFLNNLTIEHEQFDIRLLKLSIEQHIEGEEEKETVLQLSVNDCQLTDDELEEIDHHREKAKEHEIENNERDAKADHEKEKKTIKKRNNKEDSMNKEQDKVEKSGANEKEEKVKDTKGTGLENHKETDKEPLRKEDAMEEELSETEQSRANDKTEERDTEGNKSNSAADKKEEQKVHISNVKPEPNNQEDLILNKNGEKVKPELVYLDLDENEQKLMEAMRRKKGPIVVYIQKNSGQMAHWFLKRR